MAARGRGVNHFSKDLFAGIAPPEPDHNYPKTHTVVTHVEVDDEDALYIYVPGNGMPPNKFHQYIERVAEEFKTAFPSRTIIVGANDLKFTVISKKQEFKAKLDGTL